jgi:hypothetical protein
MAWILVVLVTTAASGQSVLLDDFQDGLNPQWIPLDTNVYLDAEGNPLGPKPWGPGLFEVADGALSLRTTGPVPPNPALPAGPEVFDPLDSGTLGLAWGPSLADPSYSNGRLRATVRAHGPTDVVLVVRGNPTTLTSYSLFGSGSYGLVGFTRNDTGSVQGRFEQVPGVVFTPDEDWTLEFGVLGDVFSMKAWKVGEPEPLEPQLTVVDTTYALGGLGVFANLYTNNIAMPTAVNATFENVYFTAIPEPDAVALVGAAMGLMPMYVVAGRSKRRVLARRGTTSERWLTGFTDAHPSISKSREV